MRKIGIETTNQHLFDSNMYNGGKLMKHFERLLLLVLALAVGGGLGYKLLPNFEPMKMIIFAIVCVILSKVFYQIDKRISKK